MKQLGQLGQLKQLKRAPALAAACVTLLAGCGQGSDGRPLGSQTPPRVLTPAEAKANDTDAPVSVRGSLVVEGGVARLCDALLESYPPQCGGESIQVRGLDLGVLDLEEGPAGKVRWSSGITLTGVVSDGELAVG